MSEVAEQVLQSFRVQAAALPDTGLLAQLKEALAGIDYELSERFRDFTDELSAHLGAEAANQCASPTAQERAIACCERFVSAEVAADAHFLAAAVITLYGAEKAREFVDQLVSAHHEPNRCLIGS